jgi:integrase
MSEPRRFWEKVCKEAGLKMHIHGIRHTFGATLASDGVSLGMIAKLMGHSDTKITERYAHFDDSSLKNVMDKHGRNLRKLEANGTNIVKLRQSA